MRILAFSDLHCDANAAKAIVDAAKDADLVIGAGDFAQRREGLAETMVWLESIASKAVYVPGNNESFEELRNATTATVLHGESITRGGITIFGLGYAVPELHLTAWESCDLSESAAAQILANCDKADIIISHSPPKGAADIHKEIGSFGSTGVRETVERVQPKFLLCGHIHDSWGVQAKIGETVVINLGPTVNWIEV